MSAIAVLAALAGLVIGGGTVGGLRWVRRTVDDPRRYVSAVAPLGTDRRFHRIAGAAAATRMRRLGLGALVPLARRGTEAAMSVPGFATAWIAGHRALHLHHHLTDPVGPAARRRRRRQRWAMAGTAVLGRVLHPVVRRPTR